VSSWGHSGNGPLISATFASSMAMMVEEGRCFRLFVQTTEASVPLKGVNFTIFFLTDAHTTFSMNEEFLYYSPASVASSFQSCRDGREHVIDWLIKSGPNSIADYRWRASLYLEFCLPITHQPLLTLKFCNPSQYHYDTGSFITVRQPSYNPHPSSALLYFRDELHTHRILHLQPRSLCGSLNFTMVRTAG